MSSSEEKPKSVWGSFAEGLISRGDFERTRQSIPRDRYTVREAAAFLGRHPKTIREWMKQGKLKFHRPTERTTYITREQLAAFLLRREESS